MVAKKKGPEMKTIKIKDLPADFQLVGTTLIVSESVRKTDFQLSPKMIIKSGWNKGFWCIKKEGDSRMYPICFDSFDEIKDWKIEMHELFLK